MTRTYLDTSALRHLLIASSVTARVERAVNDAESLAASSQIAVTELHRLGLRLPEVTVRDVDAVLGHVDLVRLSEEQVRAAGLLPDLPSGAQLRTLDAIHLQASLDLGATEFWTSDRRQAQAADKLGLHVTFLDA